MRIQHNIPAMSAYRNYTNNVSAMKKNLEKLSSGYKINRAGDDAAGLAISEKMRAQITGLETAQKNAKDGISLVQTAEGALTEVHDMLNRMVTLAEQSANGTYDNTTDRAQLQKELDQLRTEINRIADSSNFNGIKLLDGTMATDTIKTALSVADPSLVDGSNPTAATKANITVKINQPTTSGTVSLAGASDGRVADAATPAKVVFNPAAANMDVKATGNVKTGTAIAAHNKNEAATFTITMATAGNAAGTVALTIGGKTLSAQVLASATKGAVANAIVTANASVELGTGSKAVKFKLALGTSGKIIFTATNAAKSVSGLASTAFQYEATGAATVAAATATATEHKVKGAYDLSAWAAGGTITVNGITVNQTAATDVDALEAKLLEKGIKMNRADNDKNVTFETLPHIPGSTASAAVTIIGSTTKVEDLANIKLGASSKTIGELFTIKLGTSASTATAATDSMNIGSKVLVLEAKVPGKMTAAAEAALNNLENQGAKVTLGADQGQSSGGGAARYDFTFDISKLEGGQFFNIGSKTFFFTIGSTTTVPTDANVAPNGSASTGKVIKIDLQGLDPDTDKKDIADKIQAALKGEFEGSGKHFKVGTAIQSGTSSKFTIAMVGTSGAKADANLGEIRVSEGNQTSGHAIAAEYEAYKDGANAATGKFANAQWEIAVADMTAGTTITIGTKSIKIVASKADATKGEINKASIGSAGNKFAGLVTAFEKAGFKTGKIAFGTAASGKVVVTVTEAEYTSQKGSAFAAGDGMLTIAKENSASLTVKGTDSVMDITTGTTMYSDLLTKKVSGNISIGELFNVTVNGKAVSANDSTKISTGDVINFEAKVAGAQTQSILDKFKYTSGAVVTRTNGTDEGTGAAGANTHYGLTFNLSQISGGQTFAIGNGKGSKTFEISVDPNLVDNGTTGNDEKINGDNVIINLAGMDPATLEGQKAMMQKIKEVVSGQMTDFDVTDTGDPTGSVFTLNLDAKGPGTDYNLGEVRISQANSAISGTYDPATSGETGTKGKFAQVTYDLDLSKLEAGDVLTIGNTTINVVADTEKTIGDKITVSDAKNADKLIKAFGGNKYPADQLKIADGKLTITGTTVGQTGADLAANAGKVTLTSTTRDLSAKTGGLTLQIGDTAETFNQLKVDVKDCHTAALGIADISIADQESAAKAIDAIKSAINYVSDVRGTLGATQNRLDHTINNLSVMVENIQDAESTIRDVDVAEEMMAYTKNNILIQSAQAMLAQANQMPQGVLQLLQ